MHCLPTKPLTFDVRWAEGNSHEYRRRQARRHLHRPRIAATPTTICSSETDRRWSLVTFRRWSFEPIRRIATLVRCTDCHCRRSCSSSRGVYRRQASAAVAVAVEGSRHRRHRTVTGGVAKCEGGATNPSLPGNAPILLTDDQGCPQREELVFLTGK